MTAPKFRGMIRYHLRPADGGESLQFDATARDVFMWEKRYTGKSLGQLKDNFHMWDLYAIAHQAALRLELVDADMKLDPFVEAYPDLDWQEMAKEPIQMPDPTQSAASADE